NLNDFDLSKLRNDLEYIAQNAVSSVIRHDDESDAVVVDRKSKKAINAAIAYKKLLPNILNAITYLYELEYKRSLIQREYSYLAADKFSEIEPSMRKIAAYLRLYAITNVAIIYNLTANEDYYDSSKPLIPQIINSVYPSYTSYVSKLNESNLVKGSYFWDTDYAPIFKKMFSDELSQQVAGISLFFNVFHDDGRGLIVARGEKLPWRNNEVSREEYPEFIIPLDLYEKASKINHRKVERELKQEISGF
ncbi:MAG: hypothetical protein WCI60_04940, partial [bacterium]